MVLVNNGCVDSPYTVTLYGIVQDLNARIDIKSTVNAAQPYWLQISDKNSSTLANATYLIMTIYCIQRSCS